MGLTVSLRSHFKHGTVGTAEIAAAVAEVKAAGVVEKNLAPLVKAYAEANVAGRIPLTSRQAFEAALIGLVTALPRVPSSVLVRRGEAGLTASLQQTQAVIGRQTTRIQTLETEVQALSTSLTTKAAEADTLITTKTNLQTALRDVKSQEQNAFLWACIFAMFFGTAGNSVPTTAVMVKGVQTVLSATEINAKLSSLDAEIAATRSLSTQLHDKLAIVTSTVTAQRQSLEALKLFETSLRAQVATLPSATTTTTTTAATTTTTTLSERLNGLAISLEVHQALSKNLDQQISILETMKAGLTTANAELDQLIAALKADNDGLRTEIATTQRAVSSTLIDIAIGASHLPQHLDIGALSVSTKALLLDGIDGLRLQVYAQAKAMADNLLTTGLIGVSAESAAGRFFLAALGNDRAAAEAVAGEVVSDFARSPLHAARFADPRLAKVLADVVDRGTPEQRHLIEQLLLTSRKDDTDFGSRFRVSTAERELIGSSVREPYALGLLEIWAPSGGLTARDLPGRR